MKRRRQKKWGKNGHWIVYLVFGGVIGFLWFIPVDTLDVELEEMGEKVGLLTRFIRVIASDLTLTTKSLGTLAAALITLAYILYSRGKKSQ